MVDKFEWETGVSLEQENAALKKRVIELQQNGLELSIQVGEAIKKQEQVETNLARLVEAVEKHRKNKDWYQNILLTDIELYTVLDEIKEGK